MPREKATLLRAVKVENTPEWVGQAVCFVINFSLIILRKESLKGKQKKGKRIKAINIISKR